MLAWQIIGLSHITNTEAHVECAIGEPPVQRAQMLSELSTFATEVYSTRPLGWSDATKFNAGGTGFMHQFYIWLLVRALKPKHIIVSGAYNGLGTWQLRRAAPEAQIIVISPMTPHLYVDKHNDSRYFTGSGFRDFATIDWSCVQGLDRAQTLIFFDDHQSGYRRMLEAHARGFHHMMFDDNVSPQRSDHFSVKGACAASHGSFHGLDKWDDFRGIKTQWWPWNHGQFNVTEDDLRKVGRTFSRSIDIYAEMPPLWTAHINRLDAPSPLMNNEAARNFIARHKGQLRNLRAEAISYQGFVYVHTKSWDEAKPHSLYYPPHVTVNGYSGIIPKRSAGCSISSGGAAPTVLRPTKVADDWRRNYGAGVDVRLDTRYWD